MSTEYIQGKRSSKIGIIALVSALIGFITTLVLSIMAGSSMSNVPSDDLASIFTTRGVDSISSEYYEFVVTSSMLLGFSILLGAIFGLVAIIMGIVALVKKSGRLQGALAIVLALVYPVISSLVFGSIAGLAAITV